MTDRYTDAHAAAPVLPGTPGAPFAAIRVKDGGRVLDLGSRRSEVQQPATRDGRRFAESRGQGTEAGNRGAGEGTSASPIRPLQSASPREARSGFTVIELLTVIAIIGILMSIAVTVGRGIQERAKIARAKAEMAVLAAALEQYKAHYGDYPWVLDGEEGGAVMFNALLGVRGPKGDTLNPRGRVFIELSRFQLANADLPSESSPAPVMNWFNDPWPKADNTNWYYYRYKSGVDDPLWKSRGFLLYSHGPDGSCDLGEAEFSGLLDELPMKSEDPEAFQGNLDNLYYGRD